MSFFIFNNVNEQIELFLYDFSPGAQGRGLGLIFGDKFTAIIRFIRESCYDFCSTEGFLLCIFFFINKFKGEIMPHYLPILL